MRAPRFLLSVVFAAPLLVPGAGPPAATAAACDYGPYPLPYVTFDFAKMDPVQRIDVTMVTEDERVLSVGVVLGEGDYDRQDVLMAKIHNTLKSRRYDVDTAGGLMTFWGTRHARLVEVRISLTRLVPGDEVGKPAAPDREVAGERGAGLGAVQLPAPRRGAGLSRPGGRTFTRCFFRPSDMVPATGCAPPPEPFAVSRA
jgi:hypothetical protein